MLRRQMGNNGVHEPTNELRFVNRFDQLDALRGIAATIVVLGHLYIAWADDVDHWVFKSPISPYITGPLCVILFFVLSGFVLSLPSISGKSLRYDAYLVRRFCRLYIPYAVAVAISAISWYFLGALAEESKSPAVYHSWATQISGGDVIRHFLMVGWPASAFQLNSPIWSLIIEMRASILFPLLILFVARTGWFSVVAATALTLVAIYAKVSINDQPGVSAETALGSVLMTLRYLGFFVFGIACALKMQQIQSLLKRMHAIIHLGNIVAFGVGLAILAYGNRYNTLVNDIYYGVFSAYLICLSVTYKRVGFLLAAPLFIWLGNISFSLYLVHWPVMCTVVLLLEHRVGLGTAVLTALPLTFVAGAVMERWVERPSHEASKRLSRAVASAAGRVRLPLNK